MTAIQLKIPDQLGQAFNAFFADQDKDAIIADLMREAILNKPDIACLSAQAARIGLDAVKMTSSDQRYTDNEIVGMQRLKSPGRSRGINDIEHFTP